MGGTSYDVAVIRDGARAVVTQGDVDGLPVRVPMVDMRTIGAGGGSIASLDASGRLQVGPRSAGAKPGPVCYGRGGSEPTVTDVNLMLGRLDAVDLPRRRIRARSRRRARGAASGDRHAARARSRPRRRRHSGRGHAPSSPARSSSRCSSAGSIPRDFALMSFGGAGGLHAVEVAEELGMTTVIFPKDPSTFSAHGILQSDIVHDLARTRIAAAEAGRCAPRSAALADALLAEGRGAAGRRTVCRGEPAPRTRLSADLRYRGQAFELLVPLDEAPRSMTRPCRSCASASMQLHRQRFSFDDPGETVELVTLRLSAIGKLGGMAGTTAPQPGERWAGARHGRSI